MRKITTFILSLGVSLTTAATALAASGVLGGAGDAQPSGTPSTLTGGGGVFHSIADILIYIVGAVAVIMLIIGGLRYVISQGSSENVKQAKDTILYSIIGIVVAILAFAIVQFVTSSLAKSS